jgi:hypothetical protein
VPERELYARASQYQSGFLVAVAAARSIRIQLTDRPEAALQPNSFQAAQRKKNDGSTVRHTSCCLMQIFIASTIERRSKKQIGHNNNLISISFYHNTMNAIRLKTKTQYSIASRAFRCRRLPWLPFLPSVCLLASSTSSSIIAASVSAIRRGGRESLHGAMSQLQQRGLYKNEQPFNYPSVCPADAAQRKSWFLAARKRKKERWLVTVDGEGVVLDLGGSGPLDLVAILLQRRGSSPATPDHFHARFLLPHLHLTISISIHLWTGVGPVACVSRA